MKKIKPVKILLDVIFIAVIIGFILCAMGVGGEKTMIHGKPTGEVIFPNNWLTLYMFLSFFTVVVSSLICGLKSFYGLWPSSPEGPRVRFLYSLPVVSMIVAYYRFRNGKPWIPQEPRTPFPWEYAKLAKKQDQSESIK